jgi:hypothetical protein
MLTTRLTALDSEFAGIAALTSKFSVGQLAAVAGIRVQLAAVHIALPAKLTTFYNGFSQTLQTVKATTKAIGTLVDDPAASMCGAVSLLSAGDFLAKTEAAVSALQAATSPSAIAAALATLVSEAGTATGFTSVIDDISGYATAAGSALKDYAAVIGAAGISDIAHYAACLVHAADFTVVHSTLLASQVASGVTTLKAAGQSSLASSGITAAASTFTTSLNAKILAFA